MVYIRQCISYSKTKVKEPVVLNISGIILKSALKAPTFKSNPSTMRLLFFLELIHYDFIALYTDDCVLRRLE